LSGGVDLSIAEPPPRTYSYFGVHEPEPCTSTEATR
jgi:hypothetical protein